MVTTISIKVNAAHPNVSLGSFQVLRGSAVSVTIIDVPRSIGQRRIDAVNLRATTVDGITNSYAAFRVGSAWSVTVPSSVFVTVGTIKAGLAVEASGVDEYGAAVDSWKLGRGDVTVLEDGSSITPGSVNTIMAVTFGDRPRNPRAGDVWYSAGISAFFLYDGHAWMTLSRPEDYLNKNNAPDDTPMDPDVTSFKEVVETMNTIRKFLRRGTFALMMLLTGGAFAALDVSSAKLSDLTGGATIVTNVSEVGGGVDGAARMLPKYLHALDFTDSYPDAAAEYYRLRGDGMVDGGCSSVRDSGALYRNFDFPLDDRAEFVVTMAAGAGRFASVGAAQVGTNLTEAIVTSGKPSPCYKWLPGATVDGINERGVVAEINVVGGTPPRRLGGDIHPLAAVRWALDNGTSAAMVASNLAARIQFPAGWTQNFHWMIADADETWIVEDGTASNLTGRVVMTNFPRLSMEYGAGWERYAILTNAAVSITNAWYTRAYSRDTDWVSEFEDAAEMEAAKAAWETYGKERLRGKGLWQTVHTSVYDLTNRTLRISVQEQDDWYTFAVPSAGGIKEVDPTVAAWARVGMPEPMTDLTPATNYTDAATNAIYAASTNYTDAATNALAALIPGSYTPDPTDPTFSNAVLAVNLGIDTNQVAALAELAGLPISESAGTVGGLLMLLVAAVLALKRGKADGNKTYFAAGLGAECTGVDEGEIVGGTVRTEGNERIVTWYGNGSIKFPGGVSSARVLAIGGGGGGGGAIATGGTSMSGGGGGGGQVIDTVVTVAASTNYAVTIGAGGVGGNYGTSADVASDGTAGGTSSFGELVAAIGGGGGKKPPSKTSSGAGGSSGSGDHTGGSAYGSGGGGGAGAGADGLSNANGGAGGDGVAVDDSWGLANKVAAGGGGGYSGNYTNRGGVGGDYGGGHGASRNLSPTAGSYYGAGGGGADSYGMTATGTWGYGATGASGLVIIRYTLPPQSPTGIAIGQEAKSTAAHAIQLGEGANDQPMTVKFHDYLMLKADGTIPPERIPSGMLKNADFAAIETLGKVFTENDMKDKIDEILAILKGTVAALAVMLTCGTFAASVTTATKGDLPNTNQVVTAVDFAGLITAEELRDATNATLEAAKEYTDAHGGTPGNYEIVSNRAMNAVQVETDPSVPRRASWNREGAWVIEYNEVPTEHTLVDSTLATNANRQVINTMTQIYTYGMSVYCYQQILDQYIIGVPWIAAWASLTPGGHISQDGLFTATSNGTYRVQATDILGNTRVEDIVIAGQHQLSISADDYYADATGNVRKAVNDAALAALTGAAFVSSNSYEGAWYSVYETPRVNFDAVGQGNVVQFPVSQHILMSANHYPDWCKWLNRQTFGGVTVTKTNWVSLAEWAQQHGWSAAECRAMTLDDIAMVVCDRSAAVPDECIPYFAGTNYLVRAFGASLNGVMGWMSPQSVPQSRPVALHGWGNIWNANAPKDGLPSLEWRRDIAQRLLAMGRQYPIHTGDSGRPIFILVDGDPVILSGCYTHTTGPSYALALPAIRAFVEAYGDTIKIKE